MRLILILFALGLITSCSSSYPMNQENNSDVNRNMEELNKREEQQKKNTSLDTFNDYGKPNPR